LQVGKIRYYGCSNLPAWQVVEAQWAAKTCPASFFAKTSILCSFVTPSRI
jgi:aryl-alcohol dehydrogenase-like predicted oxidoreductase